MTGREYPEQPWSRPAINMWQTGRLAFARATAHPAEKRRSLGMLLAAADLPGTTWRLLGESSWRMGVGNRFGAISHRARKSGSCTAIRRYRREDPAGGLFIQIGPYASVEDAVAMAAKARSAGGVTWTGVTRLEEREVTDIEVPDVDDALVWEHRNTRDGVFGYQRFISGRAGSVVFIVAGSARDPGIAWDDLVPIATAQAARIRAQDCPV